LPGEAKALLAAALWAAAGIVFAANMRRIGPVTLNAIRSGAALVFVCLLVPFAGTAGQLGDASVATVVAMIGSGILAIALGDTLFFAALPALGASLAVPIASSVYPMLTFLVAVLWLDETITWAVVLGGALTVLGIFLLLWRAEAPIQAPDDALTRRRFNPRGAVLLLMVSTIFWTASTTWLKAGSGDLGPVAVGVLRTGGAATFLLPVLSLRWNAESQRPAFGGVTSLIVAGVVAIGVGGLLYIAAVQEAGAGKTAILTSTMPLFNLPLAVLFLRERVTPRIVAGTIAGIAGIALIV